MKRVVMFAAVVVLLAIPAGLFAAVYSENFDAMTAGSVPTGWTSNMPGTVVVSNANPYSGANALKLSNLTTNSGIPNQSQVSFGSVTGQDFVFNFKFRYTESSAETKFMLGLSYGGIINPEASQFLLKTGGSGNQWIYDALGNQVTAAPYDDPAFDYYVDMTQEYKWDAVNSIYSKVRTTFTVAQGTPWWFHPGAFDIPPADQGGGDYNYCEYENSLVAYGVDTFDTIMFQSFGNDLTGYLYIDNLSITPEPATMMLLGLGGLLMRRRFAKEVEVGGK
jgi:hypothetical protein